MEKPTPITKEYYSYLNSLPSESISEKLKELTEDDKRCLKIFNSIVHGYSKVEYFPESEGISLGDLVQLNNKIKCIITQIIKRDDSKEIHFTGVAIEGDVQKFSDMNREMFDKL